jgi:hypothetical protein
MKTVKINLEKLEKQVFALEMKSNYVNAEYYHPRFIKMSKLLTQLQNS